MTEKCEVAGTHIHFAKLKCIEGDRTAPWTVCIATAAPEKVSVHDILAQQPESVEADVLSGDCIQHPERMVVGTIHDLKGFEFRLVIIVGCDHGVLPSPGVASEEIWRDALRLYVAMTRARDRVYLVFESEPSEFVNVMGDTVVQRQEPIKRASDNGKKPVKQIVFAGERFDVMSVRRWRERVLGDKAPA